MTDESTNHHCPGCGATQRFFPRYPWHFCNDCLELTEDGKEVRLQFSNVSASGGLQWRRAGSTDWTTAYTVICRIKERPVTVREARFGGVVAEPFNMDRILDDKYVTDLSRP